jgi:hypothetical protein
MTPKEKANDLFDKMHWSMPHPSTTNAETYIISKMCAIVAVDEILKAIDWHKFETPNNEIEYWAEVKQEIENLQ